MIDETLLKKHSIGKDGFVWWLGQVCEAETWWPNFPLLPTPDQVGLPGFADRVKVSILGYHSSSKDELKNDELPWAYCLKPTTAGGSMGGAGESINLQGGEWVFGFFLDGEDGQQPVIIGVLGKSEQQDFRLELPKSRFEPFSGFTNRRAEPLTQQKRDDAVSTKSSGKQDSIGSGGVKVESKLVDEQVRLEGSNLNVSPKAVVTEHEIEVATGDMQTADDSDCNNPMDIIDLKMKRLSRLERINEKVNGIYIDKSQNLFNEEFMQNERATAAKAIASAQAILTTKQEGATLEGIGKAVSQVASFAPVSKMLSTLNSTDDTTQNIIGQFASVINALPGESARFVNSTSKKLASQPPCVVEGHTAALMAKTLGSIDSGINRAMSSINSAISGADKAGSLAKQGMGAVKAIAGGDVSGLTSMLTSGLSSLGGVSVPLDGLPKFTSSYKKFMSGERPFPCVPKTYNSAAGPGSLPEMGTNFGNVLDKVSAAVPAMQNLTSGISDFTKNNSIYNTAINLNNVRKDGLGGIGGIDDALKKASNLSSYTKFPGTTGNSIIENTMTLLEGGETIDAAVAAADIIFPGGGSFVKEAFENQLQGKRTQGNSCSTGPSLNGPPLVDIWGGDGNGATANAVVGPNGNILAVQVKNCGKGWSKEDPPYVAITDSSGRGKGAVIRAILDEDKFKLSGPGGPKGYSCIKEIEVVEPGSGYMAKPDGSVGGNGMDFAKKDDTVFKDKDGNYYKAEPNTKVTLPPGSEVWFPIGTQVELPTSTMTNKGDDVMTQQAIDTATSRVGNKGKGLTTYGYIDYRQIKIMHDFDHTAGNIAVQDKDRTGGAEEKDYANMIGFGHGVDYPAAKAQGYSDADIRYYLESYFVPRLGGKIGQSMQKLLDDPTWGLLPVKLSGGKRPGKIKSLQIVLDQGFKGFSKVTDGSRVGAGPILSLRDAVTDRKISNILEFQTGNWMNLSEEHGNSEIIEMFKEAELVNIEGITDVYGSFGEAGMRTWAQTRNEAGAKGGGLRLNILGEKWKTLDPWRAGLEEGTRLKFRGCYNHNTGLTAEQFADPYNIEKNNYRYFVYDYEVEVYKTAFGYPYAAGNIDPVKTTWYKLIDIHYVTGSEDWFNGEVVHKRCNDKAGRLYEMHIKVCTYDDEKVTVTGGGLNSNAETMEIVKTALPCIPEIIEDKYAKYRRTRWHRKEWGNYTEDWGHIPGTERNTLVKKIVEVYNSFGDPDKSHLTDFHNAATERGARQYVDKNGMDAQVKGYLKYLDLIKEGKLCEKEEYVEKREVPGYNGPGVYLDLRNHPGMQTITFRESVDSSSIHHIMEIPGVGTFSEEGNLKWGSADLTQQVNGGKIYGPIRGPRARGVWIGNENPPNIKKNDLPQSLRNNKNCILEEGGDDFDDFGLGTSVGVFTRFDSNPSLPPKKGTRHKKTTPLTEEEYKRYTTDFRVVESRAFKCLEKDIWKHAISAARSQGPVVKEEHYCEWATQYVEESRRIYQEVDTISYKLPCGAEFTTPPPGPPVTQPPEPRLPIRVKQGKINRTGSGYDPNTKILVGGEPAEFDIGPQGRIIGFRPPVIPVTDYPEIEINSEFGAGADLEVDLEVGDPNDFPDLDPLQMIEVVDCVGKNVFIVES